MKLIIGTRGSKLSLAQTNWIISELKKLNPEAEFEIKPIKTQGDLSSRPLFTMDQKGIFEKEIDRAVAENEVDFAVHSLKDVPSELASNLLLSCIPVRESINDVFISQNNESLDEIATGSVVGTSSLRRAVQVTRLRSDLKVKSIRGNIETRVKKTQESDFDAIVLAEAGIRRLGLDVKYSTLSIKDFPPSPGQGALGIVTRATDSETISVLKKIENENTRLEIEAERAISKFVESGCRFPVGAFAQVNSHEISLTVIAYSIDGKQSLMVKKTGDKNEPKLLGEKVGKELQEKGVNDLALNWREKLEEWNKK